MKIAKPKTDALGNLMLSARVEAVPVIRWNLLIGISG